MKVTLLSFAVMAATLIGFSAVVQPVQAGYSTCTTTCYGNSCTTNCY